MIRTLDILEMFSEIAVAMSENREWLCRLDGEEGDGDHGMTMSYVFTLLEDELTALDPSRALPAELFDMAAEAFLKVDARSAVLYASAFRRAGSTLLHRRTITPQDFGRALAAMESSFREKGRPGVGRHNMADVWRVAAAACQEALQRDIPLSAALDWALAAALDGRFMPEAGRHRGQSLASDLSAYDAGGVSALLILRAMRDSFSEESTFGLED